MRNRIAIFQYDFLIQSYTKNLILSLAEAGYDIDFFTTYDSIYIDLVNVREFNDKNIVTYIQGDYPLKVTRLAFKIYKKLRSFISKNEHSLDPIFLNNSKEMIKGRVPKSLTYFYIFSNLLLLGGLESLLKSIFHNFFAGTKIVLIMELIIEGI